MKKNKTKEAGIWDRQSLAPWGGRRASPMHPRARSFPVDQNCGNENDSYLYSHAPHALACGKSTSGRPGPAGRRPILRCALRAACLPCLFVFLATPRRLSSSSSSSSRLPSCHHPSLRVFLVRTPHSRADTHSLGKGRAAYDDPAFRIHIKRSCGPCHPHRCLSNNRLAYASCLPNT